MYYFYDASLLLNNNKKIQMTAKKINSSGYDLFALYRVFEPHEQIRLCATVRAVQNARKVYSHRLYYTEELGRR